MAKQDLADACLRVVSNRCRNLRKAIDKAKVWEHALDKGTELNAEQLNTVNSIPKKEAVLNELQEILRKQTSIIQSFRADADKENANANSATTSTASSSVAETEDPPPKTTEDTSADKTIKPSSSTNGNSSPEGLDSMSAVTQDDTKSDAATALTDHTQDTPAATVAPSEQDTNLSNSTLTTTSPVPASLGEDGHGDVTSVSGNGVAQSHISKIVHELEEKHSKDLQAIKTACVQAILNLFHVSDFLKQPGSRDSILAWAAHGGARALTDLDFDILCYFHVMLTSPNGYVPHRDAVDVSTAHCLEYLKASRSEAFKGTTYADLAEIVHAVATCPLMTDRGKKSMSSQFIDDPLLSNIQG